MFVCLHFMKNQVSHFSILKCSAHLRHSVLAHGHLEDKQVGQTDRQTNGQPARQTDRQTDGQIRYQTSHGQITGNLGSKIRQHSHRCLSLLVKKCIIIILFFLDFGLSQLTILQFILYHVAGFYKPTIPQSQPSHLQDYSTRNNARLEFSTNIVPCFDEWCLKMVSTVVVLTQDLSVMSLLP